MRSKYPMIDGGPSLTLLDFLVLGRRLYQKFKVSPIALDISDNLKDRELAFDEEPNCEACGSTEADYVLTALDGNKIVECKQCGLWFTSPRVSETKWINWLLQENERNREFTENRLQYGVALSRNIPEMFSFWWKIRRYRYQKRIKNLIRLHKGNVEKIHDVGCGVGYLLKAAENMGLKLSGNDLNQYAVKRMKELFNFDVHVGTLYDLVGENVLKINSYDVIYMNDYIEHSYHPCKDIKSAFDMLRDNGLVYISTFIVDTQKFRQLGKKWDMFMWNHAYHFTEKSITEMLISNRFKIVELNKNDGTGTIEIIAEKVDI